MDRSNVERTENGVFSASYKILFSVGGDVGGKRGGH